MFQISKRSFLIPFLLLAGTGGCQGQHQQNRIVFGTERPPISLDPRFAIDTHSENTIELLFNGLLRVNEQLEIVPDLAKTFQAVDARTYLFELRDDIKFHDATPVTAEDVKDTFEFLADPKNASPYRSVFRQLDRVDVLKDGRIKVALKEPYAFFPIAARRPILPRELTRTQGKDFKETPVGTGPFRLIQNRGRDGVELGTNIGYFNGAPKVGRVYLRPILDTNVRLLELMKGTIDIIQNTSDGYPPGALEKLQADPNIELHTQPATNVNYLNFNMRHTILRKKRVRHAMAYAIDRDSIIKFKLAGFAKTATGLLPPMHWAYEPKVPVYKYDPTRAKRLLDQVGLRDPDGKGPKKRFKIVYKTSTNPQSVEIAQVIAGQLQAVGIDVELRSLDFAVLFSDIKKGNFDIYTLQWTSVLIPDHYYDVFHSKSVPPDGFNRNFYSNPKLDRLLERGRRTVVRKEQKRLYSEAQRIVAEDLPCLPLWYPEHIAAVRKRVKKYSVNPRGTYDALSSVILSSI